MVENAEPKMIDKRIYDRTIRNGTIDDKGYEKHLKNLPDVAEKGQPVTTTMQDEDEASIPEAPPSAT